MDEVNFANMMAEIRELVEENSNNADEFIEKLANTALTKVKQKSPRRLYPYTGKRARKNLGHYADGWYVEKQYQIGHLTCKVKNEKHNPLVHLIEDGTADRKTEKGAFRGRMRAVPHVRPAYDETVAGAKFELTGGFK